MDIKLTGSSVTSSGFLNILRSALDSCPLLKYISFTRVSDNYKLKFGCTPETCDRSYSGIYFESTYGKYPDNATGAPKQSVQYALLFHGIFPQSTFPLISNLQPRIKILKIIHSNIEKDTENNKTIDIRGIDHLKQLFLDIDLFRKNYLYIFIMVEMENNQVSYFNAVFDYKAHLVFVPTTVEYTHAHCSLKSAYASTIIIKCQKIDEIGLLFYNDGKIVNLIKPSLSSCRRSP